MKYREIYPSSPVMDSTTLGSQRAVDLLTMEYFEAEPDSMPAKVFEQHHILLNLNPKPHRLENWRDGEHLDYTFHQHEVVITPAGIRSGWRWHASSKVIVITMDPVKLSQFAAYELQLILGPRQLQDVPCQKDQELAEAGMQLVHAMQQKLGSALLFESLARVFLTKLLDNYGELLSVSGQPNFSRHQLERIFTYLQHHYAQKVTLEQMAQQAAYSPYHFSRVFKRVMNVTPYQYLQHFRIEQAKLRLAEQADSVLAIAQQCGFATQAHFTRVFKQLTGQTPAAWRKAQRARSDKN